MEIIFSKIALFVLFINCILYFKSFSNNGKAFKIIAVYLGVEFLIEIALRVVVRYGYENLFLSHFYFILQFILLSFFYLDVLKEKFQKMLVKIVLVLCLIALAIQYSILPEMINKFNLFEIFITSFPLITYATCYLYNMLNEKRKFYYINIGILIYLFGSSTIFLSGNIINVISPEFSSNCWLFNSILYLFYQVLILIEWKKNYSKLNKDHEL